MLNYFKNYAVFYAFGAIALTIPGCGGGSRSFSEAPPRLSDTTSQPNSNLANAATLSDYYIASLSPHYNAAQSLRQNDTRYTYQNIYWFSDANSNGRRDPITERLYNTYPLASSRVDYAHAAGLTGAGQTIAVTDDGFYTDHTLFNTTPYIEATGFNTTSHGTTVASIIAADTDRMIGVAPQATLILGSYDTQDSRTALVNRATAQNAIAINNSWGFSTDATVANYQGLKRSNADYVSALQRYSQTGVVVFAASNDANRTSSTLMESLPAFDSSLRNGWIAVVSGIPSFDEQGISSVAMQSARCGMAAQWCITADGSWRGATASGADSYAFATGTSFAAPMVSGSLALLAEAFPHLTPHQLRVRLLAAADSSFAEFTQDGVVHLAEGFSRPYSDTYGLGFLDAAAALLPIGQTQTTLSNGQSHTVGTPVVVTGSTSGDAVARALDNRSVHIQDAFNGSFLMPANTLVAQATARSALLRLQDYSAASFTQGWSLLDHSSLNTQSTHIPLGAFHVAFSETSSHRTQITRGVAMGAQFSNKQTAYTISFGNIEDRGTLLPQDATLNQSSILGFGLKVDHKLTQSTQLSLNGTVGYARATPIAGGGHRSHTVVSEFGMSMKHSGLFAEKDQLHISLSAPVAVTSGTLTLPLLETRSSTLDTAPIIADLAPKQREIDLSLVYKLPLSTRSHITAGLTHITNHGHREGSHNTGMLINFGMVF